MVISLDKLDYSIYLGYIIFKIFIDLPIFPVCSNGFRTNEALCQLSYEAPYLGLEGGRLGRSTQSQAVRHTCSGNLGIVQILKLHQAIIHCKKVFLAGRWALLDNGALCLSTPKHNGKYGTACMNSTLLSILHTHLWSEG